MCLGLVNEYLVWELVEDNSCHMDVFATVVVESIGCEVHDSEVYMRKRAVVLAGYIWMEWNGCAFNEVSKIWCILHIDKQIIFSNTIILLLPQKSNIMKRWRSIPMNQGIILMQDPIIRSFPFINSLLHTICNISPNNISIQWHKQLPWIVSIIGIRYM